MIKFLYKLLAAAVYWIVLPLYKLVLCLKGDRRARVETNDAPSYWIPD